MNRGRKRPLPGLDPNDQDLWRRATKDVEPHRPKPQVAPEPPPRIWQRDRPHPLVPAPLPARVQARELAPGTMVDLDRASAERLKRGELPIQGRLDLHGMTQSEAHQALDRFVAHSAAIGRRCVLVITGKGWGSQGEGARGVLREALPKWLNQAPNRGRVLAIMPAQPRHGGGGAFYVLLRRAR